MQTMSSMGGPEKDDVLDKLPRSLRVGVGDIHQVVVSDPRLQAAPRHPQEIPAAEEKAYTV